MKRKSLLAWVVLTLLIALVMAPGSATARAVRTDLTGTEVPLGPPIDPGIWTVLPSGNIHVRGMMSEYEEIANDPRMSGINTVVMNASWDPYGAGPMWGTNSSVIPDGPDCAGGGAWEGTWTGTRNADGSLSYRAHGHGTSGCVEGLRFSLDAVCAGEGMPTNYTGTILDPHGE